MRDRVNEMMRRLAQDGCDLSLGIGIAQGYATIGAIGLEERLDYGAVGAVTNLNGTPLRRSNGANKS